MCGVAGKLVACDWCRGTFYTQCVQPQLDNAAAVIACPGCAVGKVRPTAVRITPIRHGSVPSYKPVYCRGWGSVEA